MPLLVTAKDAVKLRHLVAKPGEVYVAELTSFVAAEHQSKLGALIFSKIGRLSADLRCAIKDFA